MKTQKLCERLWPACALRIIADDETVKELKAS